MDDPLVITRLGFLADAGEALREASKGRTVIVTDSCGDTRMVIPGRSASEDRADLIIDGTDVAVRVHALEAVARAATAMHRDSEGFGVRYGGEGLLECFWVGVGASYMDDLTESIDALRDLDEAREDREV